MYVHVHVAILSYSNSALSGLFCMFLIEFKPYVIVITRARGMYGIYCTEA